MPRKKVAKKKEVKPKAKKKTLLNGRTPEIDKTISMAITSSGRKSYLFRVLAHSEVGYSIVALEPIPKGDTFIHSVDVGEPIECLIAVRSLQDRISYSKFKQYFGEDKDRYCYQEFAEGFRLNMGSTYEGDLAEICPFNS